MSGFEVAGIVLAGFSTAHQLLGTGKDSVPVFQSTAKFQKSIGKIRKKLYLEKQAFGYSFKRLLSGLVSESEVEALFNNTKHSLWTDDDFEEDLKQHLGQNFDEAMTALKQVGDSLEDIERTLKTLCSSDSSGICESELKALAFNKSSTDILSKDHLSLRSKKKISSKDMSMRKELKAFEETSRDFDRVVDRFLERVKNEKRPKKHPECPPQSQNELRKLRNQQQLYQRLYDILCSNGGLPCYCHGFNLLLDFDTHSKDDPSQQRCFRLLAVMQKVGAEFEIMMDVDGSLDRSKAAFQAVEVRTRKIARSCVPQSIVKPQVPLLPNSNTNCSSSPSSKRQRPKVSFQVSQSFRKTPTSTTRPDEHDQNNEVVDIPKNIPQIHSLCSCLMKLSNSDQKPESEECFGYIPDNRENRYLFYSLDWKLPEPYEANFSLYDLLDSKKKADCLRVTARLELAFILAVSLLKHQSSPWIKSKFQSRDFMLYKDLNQSSGLRWLPHIAVAFEKVNQTLKNSIVMVDPQNLKESRIFSLGVILIEIGRSEPLEIDRTSCEEEEERLLVWTHVHRKSVVEDMGPVYQKVVRTCVLWDEEDNLSDENVQVKYYEEVVCKLDRALWAVSDSSKLGIDWGTGQITC